MDKNINITLPSFSEKRAQHFDKVHTAFNYIQENWQSHPSLAELAAFSGMSVEHFHRVFSEWMGISPKKIIAYITLQSVKEKIQKTTLPLLDIAYDAGLSGPGRLHDLFISIEAMSPGEYKKQGKNLKIFYGWHQTIFGDALFLVTDRGLCGLAFVDLSLQEDAKRQCYDDMRKRWPCSNFIEDQAKTLPYFANIFLQDGRQKHIKLLLKGTDFQIKIWEALLNIPYSTLKTYSTLLADDDNAMARQSARAVGTAIGMNPISWVIPCHRVINKNGLLGGYRWGMARKVAMLEVENSYATAPLLQMNKEMG